MQKHDPDHGKLMARAGEYLRCENGHQMYRLKTDIRSGEIARSAELETVAGQPEPKPFQDVEPCAICGALFWRWGKSHRQVNVDGEWRGDGVFLNEGVN